MDLIRDYGRLANAYQSSVHDLLDECESSGHWIGELSTSALSTATAISALAVVSNQMGQSGADNAIGRDHRRLIENGIVWLAGHQNDDGGWGDTDLSYSNISTTMLVLAALRLAGLESDYSQQVAAGEAYVERQGGIAGLRKRYGKDKTFAVPILANCAIAGKVDWKEVSALPFEAAWVPQRMYRWMRMPVVSYAIPALVAIGQARYFHRPPLNPVARITRRMAVKPTLEVLRRMQPASGGYLEAIPLTSFVIMGLASTGRYDHPVVQNGLKFVYESVRSDGSWPIDTNLATWTTTLSVIALGSSCEDGAALGEANSDGEEVGHNGSVKDATGESAIADTQGKILEKLSRPELIDWILACQYRERHPFTGADPGGWGWSDLSGAVPDADDTPGALLALSELWRLGVVERLRKQDPVRQAANAGLKWLLGLQNRDGGWPTFCRGWGKLPFDRSGADLTAHVIRAMYAWKAIGAVDPSISTQVEEAMARGNRYLETEQVSNGAWIPLWFGNQDHQEEENPVYGTAKVLMSFAETGRAETQIPKRGLNWIRESQNSDGGWGGGPAADSPELVHSSVEETALALEAWTMCLGPEVVSDEGLASGVRNLLEAVERQDHRRCSPIGFYFAKLWYYERLYPRIFAASALGKLVRVLKEPMKNDPPTGGTTSTGGELGDGLPTGIQSARDDNSNSTSSTTIQ